MRPAVGQAGDQAGDVGQPGQWGPGTGAGRRPPAGCRPRPPRPARPRRGADGRVGAPKHGQHAVQLAEGLAARLLGGQQRLLGGLRLGVSHPAGGRDLDRHQADAVGHDVVQLPRDADPLLGNRQLRAAVLLDLEAPGPAQQHPDTEGDEEQRPEDGAADPEQTEAVDQERRAEQEIQGPDGDPTAAVAVGDGARAGGARHGLIGDGRYRGRRHGAARAVGGDGLGGFGGFAVAASVMVTAPMPPLTCTVSCGSVGEPTRWVNVWR